MTILTIDKKKFEKEIEKLSSEIQEKIAQFGTPVEALTENEIQIELFPNRPDLLSYQNYKNAFLKYLGKTSKKIKINKPEKDYKVVIDPVMKDIRPYTACAIVKGLKFDDDKIKEIIDIQEKLHLTLGRKRKKAAIGVYPLEKIKLPIRFTALAPEKIKFQPLEFPKEINGKQILSQHPAGREYGFLLQGFEKYPIFIDSNNEILSMPPIINSHKTGKITEETKEVFIECSGNNLEICKKILNIIVSTFYLMGGKVYQMELSYEKKIITPDFEPEKMKLSREKVNKLLGLDLKETEIKKFLEKMNHEYKSGVVSVDPIRADILHEVDLIEDIAIAYGYDKFIPEIPEVATIGEISKKEKIKSKIAEIISGLGMLETSSYHLTTKEMQFKKMNVKPENFIEVKDSKTDYSILRQDLVHYLLRIFSENVDVSYPQEIFQLGKVFKGYGEKENLAIGLAPANFTKLKQIIEYVGKMIGENLEIKEPVNSPDYFIEGRVGEIFLGNDSLGYFGDVHPKILNNFKIKMPVSVLEISLEKIFR
jgi:phenylalanyl-tRNA synthetase beta chain